MKKDREDQCNASLSFPPYLAGKPACSNNLNFEYYQEILYPKIKQFLLESEHLYPNIGNWWNTRVLPGLKTGERLCNVVLVNNEIAGLSIIKRARKSAKLCTLKVHSNYRGSGIGQFLLQSSFADILSKRYSRVHYTISEEIMSDCGEFFSHYGFGLSTWKKGLYIKGIDELIFSTNTKQLMTKMMIDLCRSNILLSIKPKYAELIEQGEKRVEFRRKFSSLFTSTKALFYISSPAKEIRFSATIDKVIKSDPSYLWETFNDLGGVDHKLFCEYFKGVSEGSALFLSQIQPLAQCVSLADIKQKRPQFKPPQSYRFLTNDDPLSKLL